MKDTSGFLDFLVEAEGDDDMRLDRGLTGKLAHMARLFCIGFACAVWPFLLWWTKF